MPQTANVLNDRAIVVGIARYPRFGTDGQSANDLKGPVNDAVAMASWLVKEAQASVTLVTSNGVGNAPFSVTELRPNPQDLQDQFLAYISEANSKATRRLGRRLYVYMAGHGFVPEPRNLSLITADAMSDVFVPNIQATSWIDWFAEQLYFDEFVLWMDCCATRTYVYEGGKPLMKKVATRQDGRGKVFMGFAAGASRSAFEGEIEPGGDVRGFFTDRLLRGLNGAAAHGDGKVRTSGLIAYFKNPNAIVGDGRVDTAGEGMEIRPVFPETDELVLADVGKNLPEYVFSVPVSDGALIEILDKDRIPMASGTVTNGVVKTKLGLGIYKAIGPNFAKVFEISSGTRREVNLA